MPEPIVFLHCRRARAAVNCAAEMQLAFAEPSQGVPESRRMSFRMGINLGEITVDAHMALQHYLKDEDAAHHRDGLSKAGLPA